MEKIATARGLMIGQLRDIYDACQQLSEQLDKMHDSATDLKLKRSINSYIAHNDDQLMHLKQVFSELYIYGSGERSLAMHIMPKIFYGMKRRSSNTRILDAVIIDTMQHIVHYKMAAYGNIRGYTKILRLWHIVELMYLALEDEKKYARKLATLSEEVVNPKTMGNTIMM